MKRSPLSTVAPAAAALGAVGSVLLNFAAGLYKSPPVVIAMFVPWVAAPSVAMFLAERRSTLWPARVRAALHGLMVGLTFASLTAYVFRVLKPPSSTPASTFVAVPLLCWLAMGIVLPASALMSRDRSRSGQRP